MPKRDNVKVDLDRAIPLIKEKCRSFVVFAERMNKTTHLVTEWKRGKCLPTPEEAARMCGILQCDPSEILVEEEDIIAVNQVLYNERALQEAESKKAELDAYLDEMKNDPEQRILFDLAKNATKEQLQATVAFLRVLRGETGK